MRPSTCAPLVLCRCARCDGLQVQLAKQIRAALCFELYFAEWRCTGLRKPFRRVASTDRGTTGRWGRKEDEQRTLGDGEGK